MTSKKPSPPDDIVEEFMDTIDHYEMDLRKHMTRHLDYVERNNINYDTVHHLEPPEID